MADYDKLVDKLFEGESANGIKELNELILSIAKVNFLSEEQDERQLNTSKIKEEIFRLLPKFEFRERRLGTIDTETNKLFRSFLNSKLEGGTLQQKVSYLSSFCKTGATGGKALKSMSINEIFSTLTVLKIIEGIIKDSTPQAGGHQWEALIAALFSSGYQVGDKSATDVVVAGMNYQVKLISEGTDVKVAFSNLEKYFQGDKDLGFIISVKGNEELTFYQYFLKKEKYNALKQNFLSRREKKKTKPTDTSPVQTEPSQISEAYEEKIIIPKSDYEQGIIGSINMNDAVFNTYSTILKKEIGQILENLASLIENVNKFYTTDVNAGSKAIDNANYIAANITKPK